MLQFRFAQLTPDQLMRLRELEQEFGDVCLIAFVDAAHAGPSLESRYVLEAKIGVDDWRPLDCVFEEVPPSYLLSRFSNRQDAHLCKTRLKAYLNSTRYGGPKYPVRIRALFE